MGGLVWEEGLEGMEESGELRAPDREECSRGELCAFAQLRDSRDAVAAAALSEYLRF